MNILLFALGSHGDVHPFCGIGIRLRQRGHHVRIAANGYFRELLEGVGLEFIECGTADEYRQMATSAELWHPFKSLGAVFRGTAKYLRPMYQIATDFARQGGDVIAASSLALGARVAQDKHAIPLVTIHLSPSIFLSAHAPPRLPGLRRLPRWAPLWVRRAAVGMVHRSIDALIAPPLNAFRAEVGLGPVRGILKSYWHSPLRVIGLFPEWFAPIQPDWPAQTRLSGFPLWDEPDLSPMTPELERFLAEGPAPIAFTPGSAMWRGREFFESACGACQRLNQRGLLLTRHTEHLPARLPEGVIHVSYAPFSRLLKRCAALVHHGGIGTTAQALASGIPQLVVPFAHDQPDNAARVQRLACGGTIPARQFTAARSARLLTELLSDRRTAQACGAIAARFIGVDAIDQTSQLIESTSKLSCSSTGTGAVPARAE